LICRIFCGKPVPTFPENALARRGRPFDADDVAVRRRPQFQPRQGGATRIFSPTGIPNGARRYPCVGFNEECSRFVLINNAVVQRASVMAYTFDSLGYAKRLRDGGVPQDQAEAHAEAARDFIMVELATKADLLTMATKADLLATKQELRSSIDELRTELRTSIVELRNNIDTQSLLLTVRLGAMLVVAIGALAAILKLA
jgi:hypothetical protein